MNSVLGICRFAYARSFNWCDFTIMHFQESRKKIHRNFFRNIFMHTDANIYSSACLFKCALNDESRLYKKKQDTQKLRRIRFLYYALIFLLDWIESNRIVLDCLTVTLFTLLRVNVFNIFGIIPFTWILFGMESNRSYETVTTLITFIFVVCAALEWVCVLYVCAKYPSMNGIFFGRFSKCGQTIFCGIWSNISYACTVKVIFNRLFTVSAIFPMQSVSNMGTLPFQCR